MFVALVNWMTVHAGLAFEGTARFGQVVRVSGSICGRNYMYRLASRGLREMTGGRDEVAPRTHVMKKDNLRAGVYCAGVNVCFVVCARGKL